MQEQLISFETAKLAKEKRFDCKCLAGYKSNGELRECYIDDLEDIFNSIYPISNSDIKDAVNKEWIFYDGCICPTQSLLQKWLREKHNIIVVAIPYVFDWNGDIKLDKEDFDHNTLWSFYVWQSVKFIKDGADSPTYEEALEEGLQEALKLIK